MCRSRIDICRVRARFIRRYYCGSGFAPTKRDVYATMRLLRRFEAAAVGGFEFATGRRLQPRHVATFDDGGMIKRRWRQLPAERGYALAAGAAGRAARDASRDTFVS